MSFTVSFTQWLTFDIRKCEKRLEKMNKITQITHNILLGRSNVNVEEIFSSFNDVKSFNTEEYDEVDSVIIGNKLKWVNIFDIDYNRFVGEWYRDPLPSIFIAINVEIVGGGSIFNFVPFSICARETLDITVKRLKSKEKALFQWTRTSGNVYIYTYEELRYR